MHKERETGPSYQTAWQAFTGLLDKDRKPPTGQEKQKQDEEEDDEKERRKR